MTAGCCDAAFEMLATLAMLGCCAAASEMLAAMAGRCCRVCETVQCGLLRDAVVHSSRVYEAWGAVDDEVQGGRGEGSPLCLRLELELAPLIGRLLPLLALVRSLIRMWCAPTGETTQCATLVVNIHWVQLTCAVAAITAELRDAA
jgi:hypothetical protein